MKVRHFITRVAAVSTLAVLAVPAQAGHSWSNYHWERASSNPVTLDLGDNVEWVWDGHLDDASADWNGSAVLDTTVVPGSTKPR